MPRSMADPNYVYKPRTPEMRAKQRATLMRSLGIPPGHVQIYGVFVPEDHAEPLRSYAYEVARRWDANKARQFVIDSSNTGWVAEKPPLPHRPRKFGPPLHPRERYNIQRRRWAVRAVTFFARSLGTHIRQERRLLARMCKSIERYAQFWSPKPIRGIDWALAETLLEEHVTRPEVAALFGVTLNYLQSSLKHRKKEGLSVFGSGRKDRP